MSNISKPLVLVSSIALLAMSLNSGVFAASTEQDLTEARQESQIWTTFSLSPYLRANDLKVVVHAGKATLTGNVAEDVNKDLAKQMALGVNGIKEVDNQIVVVSDYVQPRATTERNYGEVIDDASITSAVKAKLMWSKHADGLATNVDTNRGQVILRGTADSNQSKELAGRLAMNTRGVVAVDNQLIVNTNKKSVTDKAKSSATEVGKDISDSWITTKVKSTFLYSTHVDGSSIKVTTTKGLVTLTGKVGSAIEKETAIELTKNLRGVKGVDAKGLTL